ncbi:hypothetical protein D5P86_00680 [Salmonella enterica subsp. enterica serovar Infantis]|nr:hypothetical protein [Salmonella enterica subsp. enterica serovar Infantis]
MSQEAIDWKFIEQQTRTLIALRGQTIALEWHNGICDECEFVFDVGGRMLAPLDAYYPTQAGMCAAIEDKKLTVTHTKKTVKIEDKQSIKPVVGKGTRLAYAYLDWQINIEKQKAEEKKCAAT